MTLQAHLSHDLPDYVPTKRPVKVFKKGGYWTWNHRCLHVPDGTCGHPHTTHRMALEWALWHWGICR